jgi:hypothetical protein
MSRSESSLLSPSSSVQVSRHSGLAATTGTWGNTSRFPAKLIGKGCESPRGDTYYREVRLYKKADEMGLSTTQGFGKKADFLNRGMPTAVGPGSYSSLNSVNKSRSPLDGPEFCNTTMKVKLGSSLIQKTPSPGPTYQVRKEPDTNFPTYAAPRMKHGGRSRFSEDNDGPGFTYSSHNVMVKGMKNPIKSTFGMSQRFKDGKGTPTPAGSMYYAHCKIMNGEDYMQAGTTSLGFGSKVDFSNPFKGYRNQVSPATYSPAVTMTNATSPLDGFIERSASSPTLRGTGKRSGMLKDEGTSAVA